MYAIRSYYVITKIDKSPVSFSYNSISELDFEVNLRVAIINASYGLYKSGIDFAVFRKTRCNEAYWNRNNDGGFSLKNGVSPSDAINDIFRNGRMYATECATAMVIIYYKALADVYPKELFDSVFSEITLIVITSYSIHYTKLYDSIFCVCASSSSSSRSSYVINTFNSVSVS